MFLVKNLLSNQLFKELQNSFLKNNFIVTIPTLQLIGECKFIKTEDDILCKELYKNSYNSFFMEFLDSMLVIKKPNKDILHKFYFKEDKYPLQSSHMHLCGSDTYSCTISIFSINAWRLEYIIYGSGKNYSLIKQYYTI
jgi:hypothetical protein